MDSSFSLYEHNLTNKDITVTYKPNATVLSYSYKIYKNNEVFDEVFVKDNKESIITFDESGTYKIDVEVLNKKGLKTHIVSGEYKLDKDVPHFVLKKEYITIHQIKNNNFNNEVLKNDLNVIDETEGNLFDRLVCDTNGMDLEKIGPGKIMCTVTDSAGNIGEEELILNITKDYTQTFNIIISIMAFIVLGFILYFLRFIKSTNLEKKILPYSVEPIKDRRLSVFDGLINTFYKLLDYVSSKCEKSVAITNYSKRYEKYTPLYSDHYKRGLEFVSTKIIVAILLVIISLISNIIGYRLISILEIFLPFIFGFFLPDIIYMINYRIYKNKIENDLLQAIIIMNNAFKSGRSITQAVELVTKELKGPIGHEFKKMYMEISFGLSVEEVFKRLADRIKIEEVTYLTASLSILNKTGGNIIKVFSSIEKTLFNKKKLKLELNSLTGSSKIIVYALFAVPFFFVIFISLVSPSYFVPLLTTSLGLIILGIIITIYIIYVLVVRKVMKVRM